MILWLHPSHINAERKNFYINCTKTQCFWQLWILTYKFVEVNKNFCTTTPLSQWSKGDKQKCASTTTSKISICHWNSDTSKWGKKKKSPLRIWSDTEWGPTSFFFFFLRKSGLILSYSSVQSEEAHTHLKVMPLQNLSTKDESHFGGIFVT